MDKSTTSAERMKAWHKKKENRNVKNERKKERYHAKEKELTEEEHDKKREYDIAYGKKNLTKIKVDKKFNSRHEIKGQKKEKKTTPS